MTLTPQQQILPKALKPLIFLLDALGGLKIMNEVQISKQRECTETTKRWRMVMRGHIREMSLVVLTHPSASRGIVALVAW